MEDGKDAALTGTGAAINRSNVAQSAPACIGNARRSV
jgi:hypothetical protein